MLEFIISNYILFIVAAVVLLLGLFGYMMDKKKYKQYREEILNEQRAVDTIEDSPDIDNIATPVLVDQQANNVVNPAPAPVQEPVVATTDNQGAPVIMTPVANPVDPVTETIQN